MFKQLANKAQPRFPRKTVQGLERTAGPLQGLCSILQQSALLNPAHSSGEPSINSGLGDAIKLYTATGFLHQLGAVLPHHISDHRLKFALGSSMLLRRKNTTGTQACRSCSSFEAINPAPRLKSRKHTGHKFGAISGKASCIFCLFSSSASHLLESCFRDFLCLNASLMKGAVASVAYHNNSATSRTASVVSNGGVPERPQRCVAPRDFITSRTRLTQDSDSWNSSSTILQAGFSAAWAHAL